MRTNGPPAIDAEFMDDGSQEIEPSALASLGGGAIQKVQTEFSCAMAVQKPRVRKVVQALVIEEAELAGEDFFYSWTTKNKDGTRGLVEGISIEGAMIMARNWGNCAIPTALVVDAPQHWILQATFVDLETGFNVPRLFRQRKNQTSGGKMDADRAMDIAFQIGQSKAQRNAIDKAMPNWLKEAALDKAKSTSEGRFKDVKAANAKALELYGKHGVTQKMLEDKIGLPLEHWTARDHVSLSGLWRALRDRQTTLRDEFPELAPKVATDPQPQQPATEAKDPYGSDESKPVAGAPVPAAAAEPQPNQPVSAEPSPAAEPKDPKKKGDK